METEFRRWHWALVYVAYKFSIRISIAFHVVNCKGFIFEIWEPESPFCLAWDINYHNALADTVVTRVFGHGVQILKEGNFIR
jgi:hypothetical protein